MTTTPSIATRTLYWLRGRRSLRAEIKALREALGKARKALECSDCHCFTDTGSFTEHLDYCINGNALKEIARALTEDGS
jgi:peptide methionine sulfoxide reductase MsrB